MDTPTDDCRAHAVVIILGALLSLPLSIAYLSRF